VDLFARKKTDGQQPRPWLRTRHRFGLSKLVHYFGDLELNGNGGGPSLPTALLVITFLIGVFIFLCKIFDHIHELVR